MPELNYKNVNATQTLKTAVGGCGGEQSSHSSPHLASIEARQSGLLRTADNSKDRINVSQKDVNIILNTRHRKLTK